MCLLSYKQGPGYDRFYDINVFVSFFIFLSCHQLTVYTMVGATLLEESLNFHNHFNREQEKAEFVLSTLDIF